jgi:hypothetical protein
VSLIFCSGTCFILTERIYQKMIKKRKTKLSAF